jgi:ABC-type multidrug transport system ATPase subunit
MPAARSAAYAPDDPAGLDELTVSELLALLGVLHGSPADVGPRRAELVERFALAPLADRRLAELSRGQRRRASLVAALQLSAPLILVDEATATLDTAAVAALRVTLLEAAAHGAGVLLAAHDHAFVAGIADVVLELRRGALVPAGGRRCRREPALV